MLITNINYFNSRYKYQTIRFQLIRRNDKKSNEMVYKVFYFHSRPKLLLSNDKISIKSNEIVYQDSVLFPLKAKMTSIK